MLNAEFNKPASAYRPLSTIACLLLLLTFAGCRRKWAILPTPQMDAAQQFWVRVLLLDDTIACKINSTASFTVRDIHTQAAIKNFDRSSKRKSKPLIVTLSREGRLTIDKEIIQNKQLLLSALSPHIFNVNGDEFRGKLKIIINADGKTFDLINLVPLEPYLAGVVGAEMPDYWEPAALQAQAVAARTYCLYIKNRFGKKRRWDVLKTQASQVYHGVSVESPSIWQAVNKTAGKVLTWAQKADAAKVLPAYYSSTCGGHTENSTNVFGGEAFAPLAGVECPYCKNVAKLKYFYWPLVQFKKTDVQKRLFDKYPKLRKLGKIVTIIASKESKYKNFSRMTNIKLVGLKKTADFIRAEDLRLTIDPTGTKIKSMNCEIFDMGDKWAFIAGRGFGHGVGMCQSGAQGMARKNADYKRILFYYYPGAKLEKIY